MTTAIDTEAASRMRASECAAVRAAAPAVFYLHPLRAGPLPAWPAHLDRAARLGFSHVLIAPPFRGEDLFLAADFDRPHVALQAGEDASAALRRIADLCAAHGLVPLLDVLPDRVAAGGRIAAARPDLFRTPDPARALDPRSYAPEGDSAVARFDDAPEALAVWWAGRLRLWQDAGFAGFRLASLRAIPPDALRWLAGDLRRDGRACLLLGWTPGLDAGAAERVRGLRPRLRVPLAAVVGFPRRVVLDRGRTAAPGRARCWSRWRRRSTAASPRASPIRRCAKPPAAAAPASPPASATDG